jgi:sugar phosphate isomerase/epimerase
VRNPVKICLRTHMVSDDPRERIQYCQSVGATAVQEATRSIPTAAERGYPTTAELRAYRQPFDDAGIEIIGLEPVREPVRAWVEHTPEGQATFDVFVRHLDAAGEAGLPTITLHPPLDNAQNEAEAAEQFRGNVDFYQRACERARAAGVKLATHSPWPPAKGLWGAREYQSLFEAVPAPENGMIFCFGCMYLSGYDVRAVVQPLIDRIFFVHVRDVVVHPDRVDEVFPGTGEVRPASVLRLLHQMGYQGGIAPEHLPRLPGDRRNELSMAWAAGYCRAVLNDLNGA